MDLIAGHCQLVLEEEEYKTLVGGNTITLPSTPTEPPPLPTNAAKVSSSTMRPIKTADEKAQNL